jgi:serine/threonine protein kinase
MGTCTFKRDLSDEVIPVQIYPRSRFTTLYPVGRGSFGKVWKVEEKRSGKVFAMKEIQKLVAIQKKSVNLVLNERKLLAALHHPFLVNMHEAFQDPIYLYIVMDFLPGGDLRYHLCKRRVFTEQETRFFVACLLSGLEYLHLNDVVHRDIKPENLVFDENGYLKITDLGISRLLCNGEVVKDSSGTPGYMAPETICRLAHGKASDLFAVGVIAYECMTGRRPYVGRTRHEIREAMLASQVQLKRSDVPEGWSLESADFINKLLQRKTEFRLGANGIHEVKNHSWLRSFPWIDLMEQRLKAPFIPVKSDNFDPRIIAKVLEESPNAPNESQNELFVGFVFDAEQKTEKEQDCVDTEPNCN